MSSNNQGWSIKVGNLAEPIKFSNKPKLTHSTAKGGTSFSFDVFGSPILPWTSTERAKVEVSFSDEQVFIGNIISRSRDFDNFITSYNAVGYYTHTRRNPVIAKFKQPFSFIINQLLDTSGARPFITNISYHLGNIANSETSILDTVLERQYVGQYLDACLDDLCKATGIQWFIEPETGFLVLWQQSQITSNKEIDVEANRLGQCQQFKHDSIKPNFIHPEVTRVVVAKNSESILNRNVPQMDTINNYLILPNSPANQVDLLRKTDIVKQYFINSNDVVEANQCLIMNWASGGIFTQTGNTNTGKSFEFDAADLSPSATGTFSSTLELPSNSNFIWRSLLSYEISGDSNSKGKLIFLVNSTPIAQLDINTNYEGQTIEGQEYFAGSAVVDLPAYSGQTVDLSVVYDGSTFNGSSLSGSGRIEFIRVCPSPQTLPSPSSLFVTNEGINPGSIDVLLVNPSDNQAHFFGIELNIGAVSGSEPADGQTTVKINGNLIATINGLKRVLVPIPEEFAGQMVNIELEVIPTNGIISLQTLAFLVYA